jgi:acyl dehydratase
MSSIQQRRFAQVPLQGAEAAPAVVEGVEGLKRLVGVEFPPSSWLTVTQEHVDAFARTTGDEQWIHVDPARAVLSPHGSTLAHGFLTLSFIPHFWHATALVDGFAMAINYGLNSVRFPAPVPIPSRIRGLFRLIDVIDIENGAQARLGVDVERDRGTKPVCVAEMLIRYLLCR